jgi:hypothetical protein
MAWGGGQLATAARCTGRLKVTAWLAPVLVRAPGVLLSLQTWQMDAQRAGEHFLPDWI